MDNKKLIMDKTEENNRFNIILFFLILAVLIILAVSFVGKEPELLYYWDYVGYYRQFISYSDDFNIGRILALVGYSNYNPTPVLILTLVGKLFSPSRLSYILSIIVLYFFPFVVLFTCIANRFFANENDSQVVTFVSAIFIASAPAFLSPVLRGYPDICGMIFILLLIFICCNQDLTKLNIKSALLIGVCLYIPFLLRRWYAYTILTLCISLPLLNLSLHLIETGSKTISNKQIKFLLTNFVIAGALVVALLFFLQKSLILTILRTDYSLIYSAYQTPVMISLKKLLNGVGLWVFAFFIYGVCSVFFKIRSRETMLVLFSLFNLVFSFFLFTKTQSPDMQHILPFSLWIYIIAIYGIVQILRIINNRWLYIGFVIILTVFSVGSSYVTFFKYNDTNEKNDLKLLNHILPIKRYPLHVDNYPQYIKLIQTLKMLVTGNIDKIYILSSSPVLNPDMQFFKDDSLSQKVLREYAVDLRDGLPVEFLLAKYLVITTPLQIHLPQNSQRVVSIPRELVVNKINVGKVYEKTKYEFTLHNNVQAVIYEKKRPCSLNEVNEFLHTFYTCYPEWKKRYENKLLMKSVLSADITLADDLYSTFNYQLRRDAIQAQLGIKPIKIVWNLGDINKLVFRSDVINSKNADSIIIEIYDENNEIYKKYYVGKGKPVTVDTTLFKNKRSTWIIKKNNPNKSTSLSIQTAS